MGRPIEGSCQIKLLKFEDKEGKETFWHSSAHVLGESLENEFGV
jgi:threonyl-tRNA synthetase